MALQLNHSHARAKKKAEAPPSRAICIGCFRESAELDGKSPNSTPCTDKRCGRIPQTVYCWGSLLGEKEWPQWLGRAPDCCVRGLSSFCPPLVLLVLVVDLLLSSGRAGQVVSSSCPLIVLLVLAGLVLLLLSSSCPVPPSCLLGVLLNLWPGSVCPAWPCFLRVCLTQPCLGLVHCLATPLFFIHRLVQDNPRIF